MPCSGNSVDHCCYVNGERCPHSIDNHEGRRWACGLRAQYGNWDDVLTSTEYLTDVAPAFGPLGINCKDFPDTTHCGLCGQGA
jgi:hypothetical protein